MSWTKHHGKKEYLQRKFSHGCNKPICPHCTNRLSAIIMPPTPAQRGNLWDDLERRGLNGGYEKFVMQLEPVLRDMSKRGMPVSRASFDMAKVKLEAALEESWKAMQALVPDEVRACNPKAGYKKEPKGAVLGAATEHSGEPATWGKRDFIIDSDPLGKVKETRWVKLLEWAPSHDGLTRYMLYRKHEVPRDWKTGKAVTTEQEIERLARRTGDFLYAAVKSYKNVQTLLSNHMKNWEPGPDERVHPTFMYDTGTGQLSSRRPNAQNAPKHGEGDKKDLANMFRGMIRASEGKVLLEFDYRSFHAQTLAFEAQDTEYLRLAKLDIHSYLTAHLVRHPNRDRLLTLPDEDLREALAAIKKQHQFVRDYKAKRAILGYGFGMGWRKLYMMNREAFDTQADAKRTLDTLDGIFPKACAWRTAIRAKAHEQGYLLSRFGCVRWFWEVMKWNGSGWEPGGDDSESAVAFLPSNNAFCHIKMAMLQLQQMQALEKFGLINQIHDALMFECPLALEQECIKNVKTVMEARSDVLIDPIVAPDGLSVEVGVNRGLSWDQMKEVRA